MIRRLLCSQLRLNMVSGVATTGLNVLFLAIAYRVYLQFLGYDRYGVWLAMTVVLSFAQLGNLGIGQAVMKLVAEESGRGNLQGAMRYVTCAVAVLAVSGFFVATAMLLLRQPIVQLFKLSETDSQIALRLLPYVACLSVYVFVVQALNAALSGLGRMDQANYVQTGGRFLAIAVALILLARGAGIWALLVGTTASYGFVHVMSIVLIRRITGTPILRIDNLGVSEMWRLLHFGSGIVGSSLLSMLLGPFNKVMLSRYAGIAFIPMYEIAYTGSMQVRSFAEAAIRALIPEVSRLDANLAEGARERIQQIGRRCVKLIVCFGLPLYSVLFLTSSYLLRIWLGSKFAPELPWAFRIALMGSLLSLACVPAYYLLLGMGKVRHCFINHAILGGGNAIIVFACVLINGDVSLYGVLASVTIGTLFSSTYIIIQNRRALSGNSCLIPAQ